MKKTGDLSAVVNEMAKIEPEDILYLISLKTAYILIENYKLDKDGDGQWSVEDLERKPAESIARAYVWDLH